MRRQGHTFLICGEGQSRASLRAETLSLTNLISLNRVVQNWVLFVPINIPYLPDRGRKRGNSDIPRLFVENHLADPLYTMCIADMSVVKKVLDQKTRNLKIFEQPFDSKIDETVSTSQINAMPFCQKGYKMSIPSTS
jgi:hypothetical protein